LPRTPSRGRTVVNAASLERLGAPRLAELLALQARHDRNLRNMLALALAEAAGGDALADHIDRRLLALARGRQLDRDATKALHRELDGLRQAAAGTIAGRDPRAAIERLRQMIDIGPAIALRTSCAPDMPVAWQNAVLADLARLWTAHAPADPQEVFALALACCTRSEMPLPAVLPVLAPVLDEPGLRALWAQLKVELEKMPAEQSGGRWGAAGPYAFVSGTRTWQLRQRLGEIADMLGDVDGYVALETAQPRPQVNVRAIVERLLKAGRGEEALAWLDDGRYQNRQIPTLDLRLAALDAIGRGDEAQALRWRRFERHLDRAMLKDYLRRLPDFEDFEAERRAMAVAVAARSVSDALAFLLAWPDLDGVARLVRERHGAFRTVSPELLLGASEALRDAHSQEAAAAIRAAVTNVLDRHLSYLHERAARALADAATLDEPAWLQPAAETHVAWVDRLRQQFGRRWSFWHAFDAAAIS
jgi:hypothetical protein